MRAERAEPSCYQKHLGVFNSFSYQKHLSVLADYFSVAEVGEDQEETMENFVVPPRTAHKFLSHPSSTQTES